ncbi:MAG: hypothetical protein Kow0029_22940 [Candidatus Rifleibacteriota bacterium]
MYKLLTILCILCLLLTGCLGKPIEGKCAEDMKSESVEKRLAAAKKLGEVATAEALRILYLHEDDPDYRVREAVQKSIKKINARTFLN